MIGLAIGIIAGGLQFWLLSQFTKLVSLGKLSPKCLALGLLQFFLPMGVLIGVAFIIRQDILWAGIGIAATLIISAVTKFVRTSLKVRGREGTDA